MWFMFADSYSSFGANILSTQILFPPEPLQMKSMFLLIIHKFGIQAAQQPGANAKTTSPGRIPLRQQFQTNKDDGSVFSNSTLNNTAF